MSKFFTRRLRLTSTDLACFRTIHHLKLRKSQTSDITAVYKFSVFFPPKLNLIKTCKINSSKKKDTVKEQTVYSSGKTGLLTEVKERMGIKYQQKTDIAQKD